MPDVLPDQKDIVKPGDPLAPEVAVDLGNTPVDVGKVDDIEVLIVDDTPPEDRNRPRRAETASPDIPDDDEVASYSDNVQKRIKQLKYEYHEERRAKEEALRERDATVNWAKGLLDQSNRQRQELSQGEDLLIKNVFARLEGQLASARSAYKAAHEAGDSDALVKAQEDIARIQAEIVQAKTYQPRYRAPTQERQPPAPAPQPTRPSTPVQVDPRAQAWFEKNPWYHRDPEMTRFAAGVHDKMKADGVAIGSDDYWAKLDEAVHKRFPERFEAFSPAPKKQPPQIVAAGNRTPRSGKTVQLTQSEVNIARKLGVPLQQYAAQKLRQENK